MSLAELLVVVGIFSMMLVTVVAVEHTTGRSIRKTELQSDSFRAASLAMERLRWELAPARVLAAAGSSLTYQLPVRTGPNQDPASGPWGQVLLGPTLTLALDPSGVLVRSAGSETDVVQNLGPQSDVVFELGTDELRITIRAQRLDPDPSRSSQFELQCRLHLLNQG